MLLVAGLLPMTVAAQAADTPDPLASILEVIGIPPTPATPVVTVTANPAPQINVEYSNGQLTLATENATLEAVLAAVSAKTGIEIEVAPAAGSEKVDIELGPGDAKEVLVKLLSSPHLDYIMMGSADDPNTLGHIEVRTSLVPLVAEARPVAGGDEQNSATPDEAAAEPIAQTTEAPTLPPDQMADYWKRAEAYQQSLERERNLRQIQLIDKTAEGQKKQYNEPPGKEEEKKEQEQEKDKPAEPK
ncbi:MAG: hypothetical protein DMG65_09745 [Candidatus Angelobacter sp. Gp1-AA117]|nr:MAG: hypothetical protein DMG65_09745 [Candidatus Angelobacter sp. Gp1-AA117]